MVDWVLTGKGTATRKWDGIAIMVSGGSVFRRFEWKPGSPVPQGFIKCQDPNIKYPNMAIPGWVPVNPEFLTAPKNTDEKHLRDAWEMYLRDMRQIASLKAVYGKAEYVNPYAPEKKEVKMTLPDGTYELCGPDNHGNHEQLSYSRLYAHGANVVKGVPRTYEGLKKFLETYEGEGIVWHLKTGAVTQMAKIKRSDFGYSGRPKPVVEEVKDVVADNLVVDCDTGSAIGLSRD